MELQEQIDRLRALSYIQTADVNALYALVRRLERSLRPHAPDLPDLSDMFLEVRKRELQRALENLEKTHPGEAARFQQLIDQSCTIFPYDY